MSRKATGPFPEYELALCAFFGRAVHDLGPKSHPLLARMQLHPVASFSPESGTVNPVGKGMVFAPERLSGEMNCTRDALLRTDLDAWTVGLWKCAQEYTEKARRMVFSNLYTACQATGNVVHSQAGTNAIDVVLDALEKADFEVDEQLRPVGCTIVCNPADVARLSVGMTAEQTARYLSIMREKKRKQDASKRTRTLD